jgi:hypothetical protein
MVDVSSVMIQLPIELRLLLNQLHSFLHFRQVHTISIYCLHPTSLVCCECHMLPSLIGVTGSVFADLGSSHQIIDNDPYRTCCVYAVDNITSNGIVTIATHNNK